MFTDRTTNGLALRLLTTHAHQVESFGSTLVDMVIQELGLRPLPVDHRWPGDFMSFLEAFLAHVSTNDLDGIRAPGSVFERAGYQSALGDVDFDTAATAARLMARKIQTQVHRAAIAEGLTEEATDSLLELLSRIMAAGEAVVDALDHGYALDVGSRADANVLGGRLASALMHGRSRAHDLAAMAGWPPDALVCAIITTTKVAGQIEQESDVVVGRYQREDDVVLMHPVAGKTLATTLRSTLAGRPCAVGAAVPLADVRESLDLAQRTSALAPVSKGPVFADDFILQLAGRVDDVVRDAMHRKHFADLDELSGDQRSLLLDTLREWLLQWGHRPGIARALGVHPQTVSGRMHRVKDLLANDLEDPIVRAELLTLLIAERA